MSHWKQPQLSPQQEARIDAERRDEARAIRQALHDDDELDMVPIGSPEWMEMQAAKERRFRADCERRAREHEIWKKSLDVIVSGIAREMDRKRSQK